MSLRRIFAVLKRLRGDQSGNALMMMALGMPVLIGGSGLAVDTAQWYTWRRELQYATDQAALAGAWAKAEPLAAAKYTDLAKLEFSANLAVLSGKVANPTIGLANYNGGTNNSVTATATYTASLPFTSILGQTSTTINVSAQASFQAATNYTTCLLALDPDDPSAFVLGGSTTGTVTCGMGALSNSATAIVKNGTPEVSVNDIISAGGIDDGLAVNGVIHEYISNLSNPYDGLVLPTSSTARSYSCGDKKTSNTGTATIRKQTTTSYTYWQGKNKNSATEITYTGGKASSNSSTTYTLQTVDSSVYNGMVETKSSNSSWTGTEIPTSGSQTIYEKKTVTETWYYGSVVFTTTGSTGNAHNLYPGTYPSIVVECTTFFNPGVYYITGEFDLGQNQTVTGDDVLFIMTGTSSANFKVNSNSTVSLQGITKSRLTGTYGMSVADAELLAGMLIYDPNSTSAMTINGSASLVLEGIIYAPKRTAKFNGNSSMNGKCMMLAVGTIEFTGTNNFSSFCMPPNVKSFDIGGTTISVRLVA